MDAATESCPGFRIVHLDIGILLLQGDVGNDEHLGIASHLIGIAARKHKRVAVQVFQHIVDPEAAAELFEDDDFLSHVAVKGMVVIGDLVHLGIAVCVHDAPGLSGSGVTPEVCNIQAAPGVLVLVMHQGLACLFDMGQLVECRGDFRKDLGVALAIPDHLHDPFGLAFLVAVVWGQFAPFFKHLWELGAGRLYDLELSFGEDLVNGYFGLRSVRMDGMKFLLNGKSVFQRLVLDQGFYPDGIYTAPAEEALVRDIQISLDAGFNGARLHEKAFEPRFLYHCDRMGYMVWGEHANWNLDVSGYESIEHFLPEWMELVERDINHPAIVGWCPLNETWDFEGRQQCNDMLALVYNVTKRLDPTRPCIDTSGNYHVITDIFDVHDYDQNPETFKARYDELAQKGTFDVGYNCGKDRHVYKGEPVFVSEYGGIKWEIDGGVVGWGYGDGPKTEEEFISRYRGLTKALLDNPKLFGFCYTQLYDVEQEKNGLYTYGRAPKFDMNIFKQINTTKAAIED